MLARSSAGEHYLDTVGVAGSIPVEPTIFQGSIPDTSVTVDYGDIGNTFGPKGLGPGSKRPLSSSKYPKS
jgi:hypothetical protein